MYVYYQKIKSCAFMWKIMALEKVEIALIKIAKHETNEKILGYQIRGALKQKSRMAHISRMGPCLIYPWSRNNHSVVLLWLVTSTIIMLNKDLLTEFLDSGKIS